MKFFKDYIVITLSLAFLMSVGACNRHGSRDKERGTSKNDTTSVKTSSSDTTSVMVVALTPAQKDSIIKAKHDSVLKAKQDSANQVVVNEIAKRIKAMPDSMLDNKLAEIIEQSDNNQSKISELENYIFILGGLLILLIILYIWLYYKLIYNTGDLYNLQNKLSTRLDRISKDPDLNSRNQSWINRAANINESEIATIIEQILKEKNILPHQKAYSELDGNVASHCNYGDAYDGVQVIMSKDRTNNGKKDVDERKKANPPVDSLPKEIIYLGLPFNNQYFKAEEKSENNCFVAELSKNGNSGHFTLISLDRIKSDTISSSILNITGKVKLSDATRFETIAEGKIIKADDFWKVDVPLTIAIS